MIETYEQACEKLNIEPIEVGYMLFVGFNLREIALRKLIVITKVLNDGWKPTWEVPEEKSYPLFTKIDTNDKEMIIFEGVTSSFTYIKQPTELLFKFRDLAEYAAITFHDLYHQYYTNNYIN